VRVCPVRAARLSKTHAYEMYAIWELHTCEMAYGRGTPMRDTPMRWPMEETRLRDGIWEMHAYEMYAYCERHAYEMAYERCTLMGDTPMGWLL
jgi:hypothetical protein